MGFFHSPQRYDRSLFQRLEGAGQPTNMLSQQYRMHPAISRFASVSFYEGLLKDAPHLPNGLWTPFPFWHRLPILQPLVFFNLDSDHTVSRLNYHSVKLLARRLLQLHFVTTQLVTCGICRRSIHLLSTTQRQISCGSLLIFCADW